MHNITLNLALINSLLSHNFIIAIMVFCMVGSALMIVPAIGEIYVLTRIRLGIAFISSLVISVALMNKINFIIPKDFSEFVLLIFTEIIIGIFIGIIARLMISVTHIAGMIMSQQSGLAAASMFDANQGSQSSIFGNFLGIMSLLFIMQTNVHFMYFEGLYDSYTMMPYGKLPFTGDMAEVVKITINNAFITAFKMSSPYVAIGLVLGIGGGILSRLMPILPVFFIMMPLQIIICIIVFLFTFATTIVWFMDKYVNDFADLFILK